MQLAQATRNQLPQAREALTQHEQVHHFTFNSYVFYSFHNVQCSISHSCSLLYKLLDQLISVLPIFDNVLAPDFLSSSRLYGFPFLRQMVSLPLLFVEPQGHESPCISTCISCINFLLIKCNSFANKNNYISFHAYFNLAHMFLFNYICTCSNLNAMQVKECGGALMKPLNVFV